MKLLKNINGYTIIAHEYAPSRGDYVILGVRQDDGGYRYVTARMGNVDMDREWYWGKYIDNGNFRQAVSEFNERLGS